MTEKSPRTCANCACAFLMKHPVNINQTQLLCRRNPPFVVQQRTEAGVQNGISQPPTNPDVVCFDGWRPIGTEPGEQWEMKARLQNVANIMKTAIKEGVIAKATGEALLRGLMVDGPAETQ